MAVGSLLPDRYSLENVEKVARNPRLLKKEAFTLGLRVNARASRLQSARAGRTDGIDMIAADWDNLLILDGCRYDMFAAQSDLEGELSRKRSLGSDSWEFMETNFEGRSLHDTVYVTANPHVYELEDDVFHAVVDLLERGWDEETRTVRPETVVEEAIAAHERYPDKRLIVHFMQPHFPFIGPTGQRFSHMGLEHHLEDEERSSAPNPWFGLVHEQDIDIETVVAAYRENLDLTLPHVETLIEELDGKSVVTADHGNLIGERGFPIPIRLYGHPRGLHMDQLLAVPWLEAEHTERRKTVAEPPVESVDETDADDDVVEDRLSALGYV
ncbi:hypothetical protein SAMN04487967_1757 [Natronorubrum sediminis]|uniref:Sulfatase n=1 Tax=Natronorubrum sediminis TaxID=640943 RepID=A0A1H6FY94_9EURY|nr:hypothetical protein [Natronorubrum sediminis]SEH14764.1 hypothetical protein SAMN04487967_1757 [Natronorubrum sediminis]